MKQIYSGNDIRVTLQENESEIVFVTFNSWHPNMHPVHAREIQIFGKDALYSIGFNQVNIEANKNNWFQTEEIFSAIDSVNTFSRKKCKSVFTYGSSMGGFASINFATHLHADYFIAISPQYSIKPSSTPKDESRWKFEFENIDYRYDFIDDGLSKDIPGVVFYDKNTPDKPHAESIAAKTRAILIHVPYSGHPSGGVINRLYGLKRMLKEVADGAFDPNTFIHVIQDQTKDTPEYLMHDMNNKTNRELLKNKLFSGNLQIDEIIYILRETINHQDHEIAELTLKSSYLKKCKGNEKYAAFVELRVLALLMLGYHEDAFFESLKLRDAGESLVKKVLCACSTPSEALRLLERVNISADTLRDVAVFYEKQDVSAALWIMRRAAEKRPNGPLIIKKLSEYQKTA